MTADIAHDLRTPLTVIAGYLESLRDQTLKPTAERFAVMHGETQLLLRLVEDLHTLSLADAGDLPLNRQEIPVDTLLDRALQSYQHHAEQSGVALIVRRGEPPPSVLVDVEQIGRVLGNLISNALRYTPRGGQITLGAERGDGDMVALTVADTGAGIAPEHLPKIFERFYRADQSRTRETGGSGLGLAIVRSIIEAHGGLVRIQSTLGQGTRFTLLLPTPGARDR
jgi:signal transduction histidine kinase